MENVKEVFEKLGKDINSAIDEPWETAELLIEASPTHSGFNGSYLNSNGEKKNLRIRKFSADSGFLVIALNARTSEGVDKWNRAIFKMTSDGKFNMEFSWDQDLQDSWDALDGKPLYK